jgi:hypothetical protein
MAIIQTVTVGDRTIDLHSFTGEVVDEKKWATTHVSGSGGGYNVGSGQQNPVTISSVTTTHDQFFLRNENGQEMAVEMANVGLALRKGHRLTVIWGIMRGQERGPFVAVYNHTTGSVNAIPSRVTSLAVPPMPMWMLAVWLICFLSICFYGLGLIAIVVLFIVQKTKKKQLTGILQSAVDAAVSQARNQK